MNIVEKIKCIQLGNTKLLFISIINYYSTSIEKEVAGEGVGKGSRISSNTERGRIALTNGSVRIR